VLHYEGSLATTRQKVASLYKEHLEFEAESKAKEKTFKEAMEAKQLELERMKLKLDSLELLEKVSTSTSTLETHAKKLRYYYHCYFEATHMFAFVLKCCHEACFIYMYHNMRIK
jgi:hypothetical protein